MVILDHDKKELLKINLWGCYGPDVDLDIIVNKCVETDKYYVCPPQTGGQGGYSFCFDKLTCTCVDTYSWEDALAERIDE